MLDKSEKPSVIVCQQGARRRYAVARLLESSGYLSALYTDSNSQSMLGKFAVVLSKLFNVRRLKRLSKREVVGVPSDKLKSTDLPNYLELIQKSIRWNKNSFDIYMQRNYIFSFRAKLWRLNDANIIYTMSQENIRLVEYAKKKKLKSIVDVFINPQTSEILSEELKKYPMLSTQESLDRQTEYKYNWNKVAELADILLCPSDWVADGVKSISPQHSHKIRVVPYGSSIDYSGRVNSPTKGRIFFAGGDPLRKGLVYLADATKDRGEFGVELDVRVAGELPESITRHPRFHHINFLGKLDKFQMTEEYMRADFFTLPSLSEGFAGVVIEAISAGCPVIVTYQTGTPIKDGCEGLVVQSQSVHSLKFAISKMIVDRDFRNKCSENCLKSRDYYSEDAWSKRLDSVLEEMTL